MYKTASEVGIGKVKVQRVEVRRGQEKLGKVGDGSLRGSSSRQAETANMQIICFT